MARIFDATNGTRPPGWAISRSGATATYRNSSGIITTALANSERLNYDPTSLALLGLLVEPAATKISLRSAELDNAYYTQLSSGVTVTADSTTSPDGLTTAELFTGTTTATGTGHGIDKTFSGNTAGAPTFWEVWAKQGATTPIKRLWLRDDQNVVAGAAFDISTGTVVTSSAFGTGTVATITAFPNGWYKLRVTNPAAAVGFMGWSVVMLTDTGSGFGDHQFNASGRTVYLWGAGFGQYTASSYIATSAASVTRNADAYSFTLGGSATALTFTFDDASTQTVSSLTGGSTYNVPTNLNRPEILYIDDNTASGVSATLSDTIVVPSLSGTGTVIVSGTLADTIAVPSLSSTGTVTVSATVAETVSVPALVATVTTGNNAVVNSTIPVPALVATLAEIENVVVASTIPLPALIATAIVYVKATTLDAIDVPGLSATGTVTVQGTLSDTVPLPSFTITGTVPSLGTVNASVSDVIAVPSLSATGTTVVSLSITSTLPFPILVATATAPAIVHAVFAKTLPVPTFVGTAFFQSAPVTRYYTYSHKRLKLRGHGLALQLKFTSVSGEPFEIDGWSIFETENANI